MDDDARALIDTARGPAWQRACQAMRLLGDQQLPNGISEDSKSRNEVEEPKA